jgi:hypothetical protein
MFTPDLIRSAGGRLTLSVMALLATALPLAAQTATPTGKWRLTAISGGLAHPSAVVEDAVGGSDTRLSPGATFGLDVQYSAFSLGSVYGTVAGSFSTLEHGANLGLAAGPGSSGATLILGTAGVLLEASDWFANIRPTLRIGAGMKYYNFTTEGASSYAAPTGDIGAGFRGGAGAIEVMGEMRVLPSAFDQGKLPLRGLTPQDQRQLDVLFTIGVTVRP